MVEYGKGKLYFSDQHTDNAASRLEETNALTGPISSVFMQEERGRKLVFGNSNDDSAEFMVPAVAHHRLLGEVGGSAAVELCPSGNLDIEAADDFRQTFAQMSESGITQFFVNLGEVNYIDSTGLGTLMQLYRETKTKGGRTWFYGLTPPVQDIFSLTRLDKAIDLYETRQEAFSEAEKVG